MICVVRALVGPTPDGLWGVLVLDGASGELLTAGVLGDEASAKSWAYECCQLIADNPDDWVGREPPDLRDKLN